MEEQIKFYMALAETYDIIRNSEKDIVDKIPLKFINFLIKNMDKEYQVQIDYSNPNWDNSILDETKTILALIYRDYLASEIEREELIKQEEEELKEKYSYDKLFNKVEKKKDYTENDNLQLAVIEDLPWYKRIYNKILKLFGKK